MNDTARTCEIYLKSIAAGEHPSDVVAELATWYGVQRPAIWKRLRQGGVIPPYSPRVAGGKGRPVGGGECGYTQRRLEGRRRHSEINEAKMALPRVDRDPCQRCGVRHDVGCHHTRAPVGMTL